MALLEINIFGLKSLQPPHGPSLEEKADGHAAAAGCRTGCGRCTRGRTARLARKTQAAGKAKFDQPKAKGDSGSTIGSSCRGARARTATGSQQAG